MTLNDARGSLFKFAVLYRDCNANEPLPVSYGTMVWSAQAGGASEHLYKFMCACVCVSVVIGCIIRC